MEIGIIGAGTMGLTLAYRLASAGHRVTVLEGRAQPGGLATWFDYGDFVWDKYYHVVCQQDSSLLGLIDDLGLTDKVCWRETKSGFLWRGRHLSMSNNWEFLTFPALSMLDKVRLGLGLLRANRIEDAAPLEKTKATVWLREMFGNGVYEAIWEPLLESKYGSVKDIVPATIMWATIRRYSATRSKGDGKEKFGFLDGGMKTLYDGLVRGLAANGARLVCSSPVIDVDNAKADGVAVVAGGKRYRFDRVISSIPTRDLAALAPHLPELIAQETAPCFLGVICMVMVLKRALSPYYITNLIQKGLPFTGIIETSNLTGTEPMHGKHLVMLPRYDLPTSEWFSQSGEEIAATFLTGLRQIWKDIDDNLLGFSVHRESHIQALWVENPPPEQQEPGVTRDGRVWNVNAELAGRDTLNNNAIVRVADRVSSRLLAELPKHAHIPECLGEELPDPVGCASGK